MIFLGLSIVITLLVILSVVLLMKRTFLIKGKKSSSTVYKILGGYVVILCAGAILSLILVEPENVMDELTEVPFDEGEFFEYNLDYLNSIENSLVYETEFPVKNVNLTETINNHDEFETIILRKEENDDLVEIAYYEAPIYLINYREKKRYRMPLELSDHKQMEMNLTDSELVWTNHTKREYDFLIYTPSIFVQQFIEQKNKESFDDIDIDANFSTLLIRVPSSMSIDEDEFIVIEE